MEGEPSTNSGLNLQDIGSCCPYYARLGQRFR